MLEIVVGFENRHALDSLDARRNGVHDFVGWCYSGIGYTFVLKFNCVAETFAVGIFNVAFVGAIMLRRCVEVPAIN